MSGRYWICEETSKSDCDPENVRALKKLAIEQILQGRRKTETEIQAMDEWSEDAALTKVRDTMTEETDVLNAVARADEAMRHLVGCLDRDGHLGFRLDYIRERYERSRQHEDEPGSAPAARDPAGGTRRGR
jgi:hypothetical protein